MNLVQGGNNDCRGSKSGVGVVNVEDTAVVIDGTWMVDGYWAFGLVTMNVHTKRRSYFFG